MSHALAAGLPRGMGHLGDQVRRASSSVVLNFAEGCGKTTRRDRRRFFVTAKASVYEVAAVFDIAQAIQSVEPAVAESALDACDHLAAMLTRFP